MSETTKIGTIEPDTREAVRQQALQEAFDIADSWAKHFETNAQLPGKFAALNLEKLVAAQCIRNEIGQLREDEPIKPKSDLERAAEAVHALAIDAREQADSMSSHYAGEKLAEYHEERHSAFLDAEAAIRALIKE